VPLAVGHPSSGGRPASCLGFPTRERGLEAAPSWQVASGLSNSGTGRDRDMSLASNGDENDDKGMSALNLRIPSLETFL
jgi:hypothetical protein